MNRNKERIDVNTLKFCVWLLTSSVFEHRKQKGMNHNDKRPIEIWTSSVSNTQQMETTLKNILPSRCTILLENLTDSQLVKNFHEFYGTCMFMTAFTSAHHVSLSYTQKYTPTKPLWNPWTNSCFWCMVLLPEVKISTKRRKVVRNFHLRVQNGKKWINFVVSKSVFCSC
jgi:hypothetical protein